MLVLLQVDRDALQLTPAAPAPACIRIYLKEVYKNIAFKKASVERKAHQKSIREQTKAQISASTK